MTPLSPDECYYWIWAQAPANGYLDHPPMVALWIRLGTAFAGDTALGVRLLAPLAGFIGSVALARAGRDLLGTWRAGIAAAAIMNATLFSGVGSVTMTPDTPLLLFWTLTLTALARLVATGNGILWLPAGCMAGLAMDSKYTAVLLAPALLAWLIASPGMRGWFVRWQLWAASALAVAPVAGVILWNAGHGWASFAKQGGRTGAWDPARAAGYLGELIGGQAGLATPLIFAMCVAGIAVALRRARQPAWGLLAALTFIPALVFIQHALGDRVQANWPAIIYPAASIAAAGLGGFWVRIRGPAVALGFVLTALVWLQGAAAPLPLPRAVDPTLMRLGGWTGWAATIRERADAAGAAFVATDNYGLGGELALLLPRPIAVVGVEQRWSYFDLPPGAPAMAGKTGILVRSARRADPPDPAAWSAIMPLAEITRSRAGNVAETYRLYRVIGQENGSVTSAVLPRPN
jgi:4-amino-4-deoxy-L-arabinose transferase-like glycosyltransferase